MISEKFRIPDHYTIEDVIDYHPKLRQILRLADKLEKKVKYDVTVIEAKFSKGNHLLAKMIDPNRFASTKARKLDDND